VIDANQAGNTNYDVAAQVSQTFMVGKGAATIVLGGLSQTYDRTAKVATAATTPSGLSVSITYAQGGSPVASPTNAGSYDVTATITDPNFDGSMTGTLTIAAKEITGSFTAENKIYDGTMSASISGRALVGVIAPDVVTLEGGTATFDSKNVGTGKIVTGVGFTLSGSSAANYTLASSTLTCTADVTARGLTVTAAGVNKSYDGNATATVTLGDNRVSGDVLSLAYAAASFADKNVGTSKSVSVTGISVTGADAGNYTANTTSSTTADIT
jgi:trimeric autotransporter adhesin